MLDDINNIDLKTLLNLAPFNVYIKAADGRIVYCNYNQLKYYGAEDLSEIAGKFEINLCECEKDALIFRKNDTAVLDSGKLIIAEEPFTFNGSPKTMLSYKIPVKNTGSEEVVGIFGVSIDISEIRHEHYILQSTFEKVISRLPGHVYWLDKNNVFLGCNESQALDAGLKTAKDIIGKTNDEMPWKEQARFLNEVNNKVMETGKEHIAEEESILADGSKKIFHSIKSPLFDEDNTVSGTLGISFDITEKKKLEEELKSKNAELEKVLSRYQEFVSNQEHDIRTPVACVMGLSEMLVGMLKEPEHIELATLIHKSAKAQKAYQNSVLEGIYLFETETEHYSRRFNLTSTLERVTSMYACAFKESQLNFSMDIDESIPKYLWGDWFRLQQILVCLLSNAIKFTELGDHIWLRCVVSSRTDHEIILSIEVEDTGLGIAEDKLDVIFEPFSRLSLSNLGKYEGRGLGLAFAKKMIAELKGEIHVKSTLNKGSVFHILVPFEMSISNLSTSEPRGKPPK